MERKFNDPIELPIKQAVEEAIKRETARGFKLKVCIGTDSQVRAGETEFATVIVFPGRSWQVHVHPQRKTTHPYSIKERMLVEVAKKASRSLMSCVTCSRNLMWTWIYMQTSTRILNSKKQ